MAAKDTLDEPVIGMATSGHSWMLHKWRTSKPVGAGTAMAGGGGYLSLCGTVYARGISEMASSKDVKTCKRCFKEG